MFGVELMVLSDNLGDALERYFRFYDVLTDGLRLSLRRQGGLARVMIEVTDPSRDPQHMLPEWYAVRLHGLSQWLIGEPIPWSQVEFAHPCQLAPHAYRSTFGDAIRFGAQSNFFAFPERYLNRRIVRELSDLSVIATNEYELGNSQQSPVAWTKMVRSALRSELHKARQLPTMEELANEFGVSGQTLRRGLKSEGTSYRQVKSDARREIVLDNICDSSVRLSEIALLAGFAETNGLVRAVKAWTGLSPSAFRMLTALEVMEATKAPASLGKFELAMTGHANQ